MKLLCPLIGSFPVTQTFAEHVEAARVHGWTSYNGGVDWGCPLITPVYAAADGLVEKISVDPTGYGNFVRVRHDGGYQSIYAHLSSFGVRAGERVRVGEVLGWSGSSGNSTGPHLHFEVRVDGKPVDPETLMEGLKDGEEIASQRALAMTEGGIASQARNDNQQARNDGLMFPKLPRAKVLVDVLNIRVMYGVNNPDVGSLMRGNDPEIMRVKMVGEDVWVQIGWQEWCAMRYGGVTFMEWVP